MDIIQHSIAWCRGEIFEGRLILLFGIIVLIAGLAFWKIGTTPSAKGMIIPLLILGLLCAAAGLTMNFSNQNRIVQYQQQYESNPQEFISSEKTRVEGFMKWYPYTLFGGSGLIVIALVVFLFSHSANLKGIGLSLALFGFALLWIDHFSEERAKTYYAEIRIADANLLR